jgi:hypothetical protein
MKRAREQFEREKAAWHLPTEVRGQLSITRLAAGLRLLGFLRTVAPGHREIDHDG